MLNNSDTSAENKESEISSLAKADKGFISDLRAKMLKFATLQLPDHHAAEDAVQEALVGALKNASSFTRQAALKTWVFAILRHKIADALRKKQRNKESSSVSLVDDNSSDQMDKLFDGKGAWQADERPVSWPQPMESIKNKDFWNVFEACLNVMPVKQAKLFMMREFIELESNEICAAMDITTSNLHVMLYRARMSLRDCLQHNWFAQGEGGV